MGKDIITKFNSSLNVVNCKNRKSINNKLKLETTKLSLEFWNKSYFAEHLFIKSKIYQRDQNKVSFRNYIPKTIYQEINMGMWI